MSRGVAWSLGMSSLETIEDSPYKYNASAEIGEYLFEYTQSLMDPEQGLGSSFRRQNKFPSNDAIQVFGYEQAKIIMETTHQISTSGMLYGCGWTDGVIHGKFCGTLGKDLLLMCLQHHRIARSNFLMLKKITKDLNLWNFIADAMFRWKLKCKYPLLARCEGIALFRQKQSRIFQCMLFLARAATCMKILKWDFLGISEDSSLKRKIYSCLTILEDILAVGRTNEKTTEVAQVGLLRSRNKSTGNKRSFTNGKMTDTSGTSPGSITRCSSKSGNNVRSNTSIISYDSIDMCQKIDRKPQSAVTPNKCIIDLYSRLRSKDLKIVSITIGRDGEKKRKNSSTTNAIDVSKFGNGEKKRKILDTIKQSALPHRRRCISGEPSSSVVTGDLKRSETNSSISVATKKGPLFSHLLLLNPKITGREKNPDSRSEITGSHNLAVSSKTNPSNTTAGLFHALLETKNNTSRKRVYADNRIDVRSNLSLTASNAEPCYVSDSTTDKITSTDPNYWYPVDQQEIILNPIQIETAWLVEESMYCTRKATADWVFIIKYASPTLKIALRRQATGNNDDEILAKLLQSELAVKRFDIVRKIIRRKLLQNVVRLRMQDVVPRLRKTFHPLRVKKLKEARMRASSTMLS
eukprot:jgi/Psemu1/326239/estExt_fgenesh1_pg.C_3530005